jgi:serine/threonine-protein kinase
MPDRLSDAPTEQGQPSAPGHAPLLEAGMVVGGTYEITRMIGQGGMGAVWEARHLRLPDKRVVVKVLIHGAGGGEVVLARFRREAEIGSRLGHPNIVQVLDFNTLPGGAPYIVLELLKGETLGARMRRGRLPREQVMGIVVQIGSALAAAHREGIVHRDLKPDNVFLCPTDIGGEVGDVVKVLDFGISKMRGARTVLTQDSALVGTPQYMAPEQATGANDEIDARTDVFALGAIAFEMLAGRPPFWGDSLASVIHAVVYAPTPSLARYAPDLPAAAAAAVERALSKRREARFPDVGSFVKAVTGVAPVATTAPAAPPAPAPTLAFAGTVASDPGAPPSQRVTAPERPQKAVPTDRVERKRAFPTAGVGAGVALLGAIAAALLWGRSPHRGPPRQTAQPAAPPVVEQPAPPKPTTAPEPPAVPVVEHPEKAAAAPARAHRERAPLAPAAAADLDEAEAALAAGNPAEAIRLAQHSLYAQRSGRAYAAIARARCAQGDLGNAKAAFAQVEPGDRPAVIRACRKQGIVLR